MFIVAFAPEGQLVRSSLAMAGHTLLVHIEVGAGNVAARPGRAVGAKTPMNVGFGAPDRPSPDKALIITINTDKIFVKLI